MKNLKIAGDIRKLQRIMGDMKQTELIGTLYDTLSDAVLTTLEVADTWVNESDENYHEAIRMYGDVDDLVWGEDEERNLAIAMYFYTAAYDVFKSILTLLARNTVTYTFVQRKDADTQELMNLLTAYVRFDT